MNKLFFTFLASLIMGVVIGITYERNQFPEPFPEQIDSVIIRDTIRDTITYTNVVPKYIERERIDTCWVIIDDTIKVQVPIPISTYHFKDSTYDCKVDGFKVSMKEMNVYPTTIVKTITIKELAKKKHWGIGVNGGYGISKNGLSPYVGVGISYNLWSF